MDCGLVTWIFTENLQGPHGNPFGRQDAMNRFADALREAGLPE